MLLHNKPLQVVMASTAQGVKVCRHGLRPRRPSRHRKDMQRVLEERPFKAWTRIRAVDSPVRGNAKLSHFLFSHVLALCEPPGPLYLQLCGTHNMGPYGPSQVSRLEGSIPKLRASREPCRANLPTTAGKGARREVLREEVSI